MHISHLVDLYGDTDDYRFIMLIMALQQDRLHQPVYSALHMKNSEDRYRGDDSADCGKYIGTYNAEDIKRI